MHNGREQVAELPPLACIFAVQLLLAISIHDLIGLWHNKVARNFSGAAFLLVERPVYISSLALLVRDDQLVCLQMLVCHLVDA